ncbi:integrase [Lysinibacillus contaminans]|uniref:Integrase n=1 Tax=Lysinibacillus contaminans TaxID=1293441 RepID=A0ABR5K170_9BACI|nr:site-specific integrase [Lysinibacillus contaminans]KOS68472.1 integrase [Lysinibacillus contaminans]
MVSIQNALDSYLLLLTSLKKSAATKKQYYLVGQQFLEFAHNKNIFQLDEQFKELIFLYTKYLQETYENVNTYNHKVATIRSFVDFLLLREWVEPFDYEAILQPKKRVKAPLKVLTKEQLVKISDVWPTYFQYAKTEDHLWLARRNGCIVQMLLETGCKPAELVHMKWAHIDEPVSQIRLSNHNGRRALKISTILLEMLLYYREATEEIHQEPIGEWLWVSEASQVKPITTKTVERIFQTISKEVGETVRATDIRYTVMQKALQSENALENIQQQMGYVRKWVLTERGKRFE